jgi:hypothetical protein
MTKKHGKEYSMHTLKKATIAAAMLTGFAGAAFAGNETLTACTRDGKTATLDVDITGKLHDTGIIKNLAAAAFRETAKNLSGDDLVKAGTVIFVNALNAKAATATLSDIVALGVGSLPVINGPDCKP